MKRAKRVLLRNLFSGFWVFGGYEFRAGCRRCFQSSTKNLAQLEGGSWDLVSMVISTLSGVICNYMYSYLLYNPSY